MHSSRPRPSASRSRCSFLTEYPFELCRVAREVRIFPLLALDGRTSRYVASMVNDLSDSCEVALEMVPYEFHLGGNQMMRVRPVQSERVRMRR
jgi:hypothetical protein